MMGVMAGEPDTVLVRLLKVLGALLLIHACVYFGALALFGYSEDRAFLLRYIVG